jgi:hypothetical protein
MNRNSAVFAVIFVSLLALVAVPAHAASFGVRGGVYTERDKPFVGAEILTRAGDSIYFNPNAEYVFIDGGQFWTFNFDAHYDLPMHQRSPYLWIGAGLAVSYFNPDGPGGSDTNANLNLLAGIGFRTHSGVVPYIQVKLITSDPTELVAAGGIRF